MQNKSDEYWKQKLTLEQYQVLRQKGTEPPFSGQYVDNHEEGTYKCVACGQELFTSASKFESTSGWPSFYDVLEQGKIELKPDDSHGMERTEAVCSNCGSHLGHVFEDGPNPTGLRYCINSVALDFEPRE